MWTFKLNLGGANKDARHELNTLWGNFYQHPNDESYQPPEKALFITLSSKVPVAGWQLIDIETAGRKFQPMNEISSQGDTPTTPAARS